MACTLATVQTNACASGIGRLKSKTKLLQTWAQLACVGSAPLSLNALTTYSDLSTVATSFTTNSYTPTSNSLVLAFVFFRNTPTITSVSGNGLTWVLVNTIRTFSGATTAVSVYRAMGVAPTSGGLTVGLSSLSDCGIIIHVQQYNGVITSGTNGSGAIAQSLSYPDNTVSIAPLNTNSLNATVGVAVINNNVPGATLEAGWTQDVQQGQTSIFPIGAFVAHRLATTDNSFSTLAASMTASIQIEIISAQSNAVVVQPSSISGLAVWVRSDTGVYQDAAKTVPCTTNGDLVYTWNNMGNTVLTADFIQATSGLRPTYNVTGGANGKPRISFNSSMMRLVSGSFSQPFSFAIIGKYTNNLGGFSPWLWDENANFQFTTTPAIADSQYIYASITRNGTIPLGGVTGVMVGIVDTLSTLFVNQLMSLYPSGAGGNGVGVALTIGGYSAGAGYYLVGDEYEVMFFNRVLTQPEIAQIINYAKYTYAIA